MKLSELHYVELLYETRQSIAAKDVNLVYYLQEIERRLSAGEEAVKKVAELEKDSERKADLFVKKCFECDEFERQASAGQRAVDAMEQNILSIVDACFHAFASSFRNDAKEMAEDLIKTIIQQSKEAR